MNTLEKYPINTDPSKVHVFKVIGRELKGGAYQYIAITGAGEVIIRKKATRMYANAYQYSVEVTSGNKQGLTLYFTFGRNPSPYYADKLLHVFSIDFGEKDTQ